MLPTSLLNNILCQQLAVAVSGQSTAGSQVFTAGAGARAPAGPTLVPPLFGARVKAVGSTLLSPKAELC